MKLALLGADDTTLPLIHHALEHGRHEIVLLIEHDLAGLETESTRRLRAVLPARTSEMGWESVLAGTMVDAVIVARGPDQELRADELRKLVQAGVPMLVAHPVLDSMLVYYELDMIRRESGCVIVPNMPWRWHPALAQLAALMAADEPPLGGVAQVVFERALRQRDKPAVAAQFARDVDLIRATCGDVTKLSAHGAPADEATYANLGVQMSTPGPIVVRWSVGPVEDSPRGRLTVVGQRGKAVLHMPEADPWRLETRWDGQEDTESFLQWNAASAALDELAAAIEGDPLHADWPQAARAAELAETIERSLAKGRTIELHNEEFTDVGTFKGTMTSLGCGLLLVGLCAMLGVGIVELVARKQGAIKLADALRFWPYWLVGFLLVFLLIQLILKLATSERDSTKSSGSEDETSSGR